MFLLDAARGARLCRDMTRLRRARLRRVARGKALARKAAASPRGLRLRRVACGFAA